MKLITAPSKITQVATHLRHMIKKNNYKQGSKLSGIRQLSTQFNVSAKTVKCALDILQEEGLIRCEHGRGVFIEAPVEDGTIEVYILLWGMRRELCDYFENILKITYPPILKPGFSFTLRNVFKDSDGFSHFDRELARIENSPHIKCVLASAAQFNVEHFEKLQNLHCPVVFFGDSKYEEATDFLRSQIINASDWVAGCIALLYRLRIKELTLFIPDGSIAFFKKYTQRFVMSASQAGIKLNLYEVSCSLYDETDHEKICGIYTRYIQNAIEANQLDCPIVVYGMIESIFMKLPQIKKRLNTGVPFLKPQLSSSHMDAFYDAIFNLINESVASPADLHAKTVHNPLFLRDYANNNKYLYQNGVIKCY